ncbi:type II toxin-antitoxin system RelE/ParE family toxin [Spirochaeta isovalerica]|uniref:Phage-related protein n=1 Tax=Spirochaeta isovalerica TaxID=150 RepID=A0A841RGJ2_9SPIO|nr:type II toxin-antitoxin system RelE/ParE family toxin [Spirochaeta isovalerica]MBB6482686.1 phage-related protein [Spirochaeta isovalerica]
MGYEVRVLQPAVHFLETLDVKMKAKAYRAISLLQEFGPFLTEPHSKKITGIKNLYELRVKQSSNICRLFYFHSNGKVYIVTSGYIKKSNKTSRLELEKAERIMNQFIEENHE